MAVETPLQELSIIDKLRNQSLAQFRPLQASLELTYRCNERCTHCYLEKYEDDKNRILSFEQWSHILKELKNAGVLYLVLMGGEAMLNPHFWEISEEAVRQGFALSMITNGLKINSSVAKRIAKTKFSHITISLYSMNAEIHDKMTSVTGSHSKTINAINCLLEEGVSIGVNCLLTKNNINEYFELADWCIERKIEFKADLTVTPKFNRDLAPTLLRATPEQIKEYYERLIKRWPNGRPKPNTDKPQDFICNVGKGKCAVTAYGELLTCIEVRESLGSLVEKSFAELWNGPVAEKWRSLRVKDIQNVPSGTTASFCEHCPGMALHETNNPLQVSNFFSNLAKIREEAYERQKENKDR